MATEDANRVVTIEVELLRQIILEILLEDCSDWRAGVLTLADIEARHVAGRIRERVLQCAATISS